MGVKLDGDNRKMGRSGLVRGRMAKEDATRSYPPYCASKPYMGLLGSVPVIELIQVQGDPQRLPGLNMISRCFAGYVGYSGSSFGIAVLQLGQPGIGLGCPSGYAFLLLCVCVHVCVTYPYP